MRRFVVAGLLVWGCASGAGAQGASSTLQFSLDRGGATVTQYTIQVDNTGVGSYTPHLVPASPAQPSAPTAVPDARAIRVSPELLKKLFAAVPMVEGGRCETHSKGIAKTGVKVLHYRASDRDAQCTFNYSDDERVNEAASTFEAIAQTLEYGDRLRAKLRFDRLGLDAELDGLQTAVADQRALEVANIAPVLHSILADERVMDRVRRKVEQLLQSAGPAQAADSVPASPR